MDEKIKERVAKLIDIYANGIFGISNDAGWHAPSQLESLKDVCNKKRQWFQKNQLTVSFSSSDERQANDVADDKMINEISYLRNKHHDFEFAKWLLLQLKEAQLLAIMAEPRLRISHQCVYNREPTRQEIADYLDINKETYKKRCEAATAKIAQLLIIFEEYDKLRNVQNRNGLYKKHSNSPKAGNVLS
jgi:hypothetical protein